MKSPILLWCFKTPKAVFLLSLALQAFFVFLIVRFVGDRSWDDGAITLAFSKSFAETGRVALTPPSEQVEGFSSVSWFLLNALLARLHPSFEQAILLAQIAAGACVSVSLYFLFLFSKNLHLAPAATALTLLVFALSGATIAETANGMEMTLLAASGLAMAHYLYFGESRVFALGAALVFISTRFEAIFYYTFIIAPLFFRQRGREGVFWLLFGAGIFIVIGVLRYFEFSELLPNTIYAKLNPPYQVVGLTEKLIGKIDASFELFDVTKPFVVATIMVLLATLVKILSKKEIPDFRLAHMDILIFPIVGVELFSVIAGRNWGYSGRMQFFAIPFALLLLSYLFSNFSGFLDRRLQMVCLFLALLTIPYSWKHSAESQVRQITSGLTGVSSSGVKDFDVTPDYYRKTGIAVDRLRQLLGGSNLVFLTPDVGGLGLCCSHIRVVDVAMLTNHALARGGYASFPAVFAQENPDVIEVHEKWASLPKIYENAEFKNNYRAILINNTRLFLRKDHFEKLVEAGVGRLCPLSDSGCVDKIIKTHRYKDHRTDEDDAQYLRLNGFVEIDREIP